MEGEAANRGGLLPDGRRQCPETVPPGEHPGGAADIAGASKPDAVRSRTGKTLAVFWPRLPTEFGRSCAREGKLR